MKTGDTVINTQHITTALVDIPPRTPGIVMFADRGVARVAFAGHIPVNNVPVEVLQPAGFVVTTVEGAA